MVIIIDSIDRVGKTTLATKLAEALNAKIYKHCVKNTDYGVMKDDCETQAMFALINLANLFKDDIIIFDRFHLSNTVYGQIERNYDIVSSFKNFEKIDNALAELDDTYLIMVNPTDIDRSSKEHGLNLIPYYGKFCGLFEFSKIKNKYSTNYLGIDELVETLKQKIKR